MKIIKHMDKNIEELIRIGFEPIGVWAFDNNNTLDFQINTQKEKEVLYAFVEKNIDNKEKLIYIGKTINSIEVRLKGYRKPGPTQTTNIRINNVIIELLNNKSIIDIYLFKNNENLKFKDYKINLASGLEDVLINKLKPIHNLHGNKIRIIEEIELNENTITYKTDNMTNKCINPFEFTRVATQSNLNGIINLGNVPAEFLPNYGDVVTIHLNDIITQANFINGNQQDGNNPRINSVVIGNWLQEQNVNIGNTFLIKICNNNTFIFSTVEK